MSTETCWSAIDHYLAEENEAVLTLHINNIEQNKSAQNAYENSMKNTNNAFHRLNTTLKKCKSDIAEKLSPPVTELIITALAIYTDEDILTSNLYPRTLMWPKIQQQYIGNKEGGIIFFQLLDKEIKDRSANVLVLRTFHHLLTLGFKGRYHSDIPTIRNYIYRLEEALSNDISAVKYA